MKNLNIDKKEFFRLCKLFSEQLRIDKTPVDENEYGVEAPWLEITELLLNAVFKNSGEIALRWLYAYADGDPIEVYQYGAPFLLENGDSVLEYLFAVESSFNELDKLNNRNDG